LLIFVHHLPPNFLLAFIAAMIPLAAFLTPPAALIAFFILTILAAEINFEINLCLNFPNHL
jgi:hypothetical protein